jgi:hypothetical protein
VKRTSWSVALYVLLVFTSGVAAGVLGQRLVTSKVVNADSAPRTPEQWRAKFVAELSQRLALDGTQVTKVNQILDITRARYNEVRERNRPEMQRIHDEQVDSIKAVLSDPQKSSYKQFLDEKEAEKKARSTEAR